MPREKICPHEINNTKIVILYNIFGYIYFFPKLMALNYHIMLLLVSQLNNSLSNCRNHLKLFFKLQKLNKHSPHISSYLK